MKQHKINLDCRHYRGYRPCEPHKKLGSICENCTSYSAVSERILIIKTGAAGDVLRTTPILHRLRQLYPNSEITWVTYFPDLIPKELVDQVIEFNWQNCLWLREQKYDLVLSLDKSHVESSLSSFVTAKEKKGFKIDDRGRIAVWNNQANSKWITGIRDDLMKENEKHYIQEIFEVCGWNYENEDYILSSSSKFEGLKKDSRPIIGLNTGCGSRWPTRLWGEKNFIQLATLLSKLKYRVILLGGPEEVERNNRIQAETNAENFGVLSIPKFISLVDECDMIVTSVTFGFHVAMALKKKVVLLNNIFPKNEFHLFDRAQVLEPGLSCQACFKSQFDNTCATINCMDLISVNTVLEKLLELDFRVPLQTEVYA